MARTAESHGVDEYLEAVYELQEEGVRVVQARIAARLGVTRASVSEQVARLVRMKLVRVEDRTVVLTPHGHAVAEDAVRRHRVAERFLTDVLEMPWHMAHEAAQEFQGGLTDEIEKRIIGLLGDRVTCPHGNPIPGTGATIRRDLRRLNEFPAGRTVVLERLTEDVELDGAAMRYFEENGLMPGARIRIVAVGPDGTMTLAVGRRQSSLGSGLADNLWVHAPDAAGRGPRRAGGTPAARGRRRS